MPRQLSHGNWLSLLDDIKSYLSSENYLKIHQKPQRRKGFISYAWEPDEEKNKVLQSWLSNLRNDLKHAALTQGIFLDIFNMHGDLKDTMLTGLKMSEVIFFICNPRFKARLAEGSNCGFVQMTEQPTADSIKALKLVYEHVYIRVRGNVDELYYKTSWGSPTNITPKIHQNLDEFDKTITISSTEIHRRLTTKELQSITAITGHAHNNLAFEVHTVLQVAARRQAQGQEPLKIIAVLQAGDIASALPEQLAAFPLIDFTQLANDEQQQGYYKRITGFRNTSGLIPHIQGIQEKDVDYTRILYRHYLSVVPKAPRLFGREKALARLNSLVTTNPVSFIDGGSGIGLSALAQHFAAFSYQQGEQRMAEHYPVVRYLNIREQDFDELTKEIAQELEVSHENWWDELLALPVPWLMVLDGDVKWEPRLSGANQRLLRVQTAPPSSSHYVITLAPLGENAKLQMVRYYLAGSNELKDEHTLIKKYVAVGSLYNALEYIRNSPWINLALFLKYKLSYNQQQFKSLTRQASMVMTQTNSTHINTTEAAVVSKWPALKAGLRKILTESPALELNLKILAAGADKDEVQKLNQDLSECGIEGIKLILLDKSAQSQAQIATEVTTGTALIIIATPNLKEELKDTEYSNNLEQVIRENIAFDKVAPLVVQGNFASAVPSFLGGYLVRFANSQVDYEKMLMALDNPLGVIPAFYKLDKDVCYNSYWHNYLLTNLPHDIHRYVGRDELLVGMHKALEDNADAIAITTSGMAITSMGGVGKSTLALMYGRKYLETNCYDFVRFLNAEGEVLKSSLATLASDLGIRTQNIKFHEILAELQVRLAQVPRYLLILDNVTKHEDIKDYYAKLKTLPGQHILVTSRDRAGWGQAIALNVFSENEALEYLQKELSLTGFRLMLSTPLNDNSIPHQVLFIYVQNNILNYAARNQEGQIEKESLSDNELAENLVVKLKAIVSQQKSLNDYPKTEQELLVNFSKQIQLPVVAGSELAAELGYLPLALGAAVAVIKDKCVQGLAAEAAIAEYVSDLRAGSLDMSANPVVRSLNLSLPKISAEPDALKLARYCAFLSSEHINPQWFAAEGLLEEDDDEQSEENETNPILARTMQRVYSAVAVIVNFSLVTVKDYELTMHRLMQEAIRMSMKLEPEQLLYSYLLPLTTALLNLYPLDKTLLGVYDTIKLLVPHMVCLEEHLEALAKKTLPASSASSLSQARGKLLDCIADSYGYLGDYEAQKELLEKVRNIKKPLLAQDTAEEYLKILIGLSHVYGYLNYRAEQVRCLEETIDVCRSYRNFPDWNNTCNKVLELLLKAYSFSQNHEGICTVLLKVSEDINIDRLVIEVVNNCGLYGLSAAQQSQLLPVLLAAIRKDSASHYAREHAMQALAALELTSELEGQRLWALLTAAKDPSSYVSEAAIRELRALKLIPELQSQVLSAMLVSIKDGDSNVKYAVMKVLAALKLPSELEGQCLSILLVATKDSASYVRAAAIKALMALELTAELQMQVLPELIAAIKDFDVTAEAIEALAAFKLTPEQTTQLLPVLLAATKDSDWSVRLKAIKALAGLELTSEQNVQFFSVLLIAIKDSRLGTRQEAMQVLATLELTPELKVQVLPELMLATKDLSSYVIREAAFQALAALKLTPELKVQILPELLTACKEESQYSVINAAIKLLTDFELNSELQSQVLPELMLATKDSSSYVRKAAIQVLAALKLTPELKVQVLPELMLATKDSSSYVREAAIQVLAALKLTPELKVQILPELLTACKDSEYSVINAAIELLTDFELNSELQSQVLPELMLAMKDSSFYVRKAAIGVLAALELTPELKIQVYPILLAASSYLEQKVMQKVIEELAALKLTLEFKIQVYPLLLVISKDSSSYVRYTAINALANLELTAELQPQVLPELLTASRNSAPYIRKAAVKGLAALDLTSEFKTQILPGLLAASRDSDYDVRNEAIKALADLDLTSELKAQVLPVLLATIEDADADSASEVKDAAIKALVTLKLTADQKALLFSALLSAAKSFYNCDRRQKAIEMLAAIELPPDLESRRLSALLDAIKDSKSNVKMAGIEGLAALDLTEELKIQAYSVLLDTVKHADSSDQREAAIKGLVALDLTPELQSQVLRELRAAIKDSNSRVRHNVIMGLVALKLTPEIRTQILPELLIAAQAWDSYVQRVAIEALADFELTSELKAQVLPVLFAAIKRSSGDNVVEVRNTAIKALVALDLTSELKARVLSVLLGDVEYSNSDVREAVIQALAGLKLTPDLKAQVLPILLAVIKNSASYNRGTAIKALIALDLTSELNAQVLPVLLAAIKDSDRYVRKAAIEALAGLKLTFEFKAQVLQVLLAAIKDSDSNVRCATIEALAGLKLTFELESQVLPVLLAAIKDSDSNVRCTTIKALADFDLTQELAAQTLPELLVVASKDSKSYVREEAIKVLAGFDLTSELKAQVLLALLAATKDSDSDVKDRAIEGLGLVSLDLTQGLAVQVLPLILSAIKDSDSNVRKAAIKVLAASNLTLDLEVQRISALLGAIKDSEFYVRDAGRACTSDAAIFSVRDAASQALTNLRLTSELPIQVLPILLAASEDSDRYVSKAAIKGLASLRLTEKLKSKVLPALLTAIKESKSETGCAAIKALVDLKLTDELKNQVLPMLIQEVNKNSGRYMAIDVLAALESAPEYQTQFFPALLADIRGLEPMTRSWIIEVIYRSKLILSHQIQFFAALLVTIKEDSDTYVRCTAIEVLATLELTPEFIAQVFPILIATATEEGLERYARCAAIKVLATLELTPERTAQVFLVLIAAVFSDVRDTAIEGLIALELTSEQKVQLLPALLPVLKDSDLCLNVRCATLKMLADLALTSELEAQVLPVLLTAAKDPDADFYSDVRDAAIQALANLKSNPKLKAQVLPALLVATRDSAYRVSHSACKAIAKLEIDDQQKEKILKILQIDSRNIELKVRVNAKETLANILAFDGNYQGQLELLKQALKIRKAMDGTKSDDYANTLMSMGECYINLENIEEGLGLLQQALPILKKTKGKRSKVYKDCLKQCERVQKMLEQTSANIGQKDHITSNSSLPGLLADLQDANATPLIKQTACLCLAELSLSQQQKEQVLPILMAASQDKEESVKDEASRVLVVFKYTPEQKANALLVARQAENEQYLPGLLGALEDDNPDIRYGACGSIAALDLSSIQKDRVLPALRALTQDKDKNVKRIAIETVAMFEGVSEHSRSATRMRC